jgi:hypothetical protein
MILHFKLCGDTLIARVQNQVLLSTSTCFVKKCMILNYDLQDCYHSIAVVTCGQLPSLQQHQTLFLVYYTDLNFIVSDFKL